MVLCGIVTRSIAGYSRCCVDSRARRLVSVPVVLWSHAAVSENNENARPNLIGRLAVLVVAGALFEYPFWSALGNLLNLPSYYQAQFGAPVDTVPWALLIAGVALPVIVFLGATAVGWKRGAGSMALLLTAGFAAVSATALSILAFEKDIELRLVIDFLVNG